MYCRCSVLILQIMRSPRKELVRLVVFAVVAFSLGFLPYVDNLAQVFGFIFGLLSSVAFFPYITFGDWDAVCTQYQVMSWC